MPDDSKAARPKGRPRQPLEKLDLERISEEWDSSELVRDRMRSSGYLMADSTTEDIGCCVKEQVVLWPFLTRMSLTRTRPVPAVDALRSEVQAFFLLCKRPASKDDEAEVFRLSWRIRKLLGFIKMKVRRQEVSNAPCLYHTRFNIIVFFLGCCSKSVMAPCLSALASEVPEFQNMCLELDPDLQASSNVIIVCASPKRSFKCCTVMSLAQAVVDAINERLAAKRKKQDCHENRFYTCIYHILWSLYC